MLACSDLVCGLHFGVEDFKPDVKSKQLKKGTIPSHFPNHPKQVNAKKSRRSPTKRKIDLPTTELGHSPLKKSNECQWTDDEVVNFQVSFIGTSDSTTQTPPIVLSSEFNQIMQLRLRESQRKYCNIIRRLKLKIKNLKTKLEQKNESESSRHEKLKNVEKHASNGSLKASLLLEQIDVYGKTCPRWSEACIRKCIIWRFKSPRGYEMARQANLFTLPCRRTLQKYIGPSKLEFGFTLLIKERLELEISTINEFDRYTSLVFDEMSIKPTLRYVKQVDKVIGRAHLGKLSSQGDRKLANRVLCFVLKGLSSRIKIPVAYYLTKELDAVQLASTIQEVLRSVEEIGFKVTRLVSDNLTVNVKAFGIICGGVVKSEIVHPCDENRPLFISYDPCHILKNARNLLLDPKRQMFLKKKAVSGKFIRELYERQKNLTIKPVRFLTRKVVYPTRFEKMSVGRAGRIFSTEVISALQLNRINKESNFMESESTIEFLQNFRQWFAVRF